MKEFGDGATVARARFCEFVRNVQRTGDRVAISRGGRYVAMLVDYETLRRLGDPHLMRSVVEAKRAMREVLDDCEAGLRIVLVRHEQPVAGLIGWEDYGKLAA